MNGFARLAVVLVTLTCVASLASAQAQPADTSTPKSALKSFYAAVERGDALAVAELLIIENDPQQELAKAYADLIVATKHLADVTKQKYPGAATDLALGSVTPEDSSKIDAAQVTMKGTTQATLKVTGQSETTTLRKSGGGWRVVAGAGAEPPKNGRDNRKTLLAGLTQAMNQAADEIAADKFPTVQDAENAIKERLSAVTTKLMQGDVPTSRPTTRP